MKSPANRLDKDGDADFYKTINADWGVTDNYHEYAFGLVRDSKGNFYGTLNTSLSWPGWARSEKWNIGRVWTKGYPDTDGKMGRATKYRGWGFQVTPKGKFVPFASGMRSPAGIGISKDDELFFTDNQGDWEASSSLHHIVKGRFHGHPSSLMDHPDYEGKDLNEIRLKSMKNYGAHQPYGFHMVNLPTLRANPFSITVGVNLVHSKGRCLLETRVVPIS